MHPALLYRPGERLSLPELAAARLDGHVVEVGTAYMPADTVEGADARASSIRLDIPARLGVCGPTAAWVHGAGTAPPPVHHVRRITEGRFRPGRPYDVILHEPGMDAADASEIAGLTVSSPISTGIELALSASTDPNYERWLRDLLMLFPGLGELLRDRIPALSRRPGRKQATILLTRLVGDDQDVVTR